MGRKGDQIRVMARGPFLDRIGKMAIPDALLKPGPLNLEAIAIIPSALFSRVSDSVVHPFAFGTSRDRLLPS